MAVVLMEGFDNAASAATITNKGWGAPSGFVTGRYPAPPGAAASSAMNFNPASGTVGSGKTLPATYTTLFVGAAINVSGGLGLTSGRGPITLRTAALGVVVAVSMNNLGRLQVSNSSSTIIATGTTVLNPGTWYYVELKIVVNGASGSCELHLDGNTEIAATTGNFGSTAIGQILFNQTVAGTSLAVDDVYVVDTTGSAPQNTFLGPSRVITPVPTGVGHYSQWTANGTTPNYACVNEAPPDGDTTYVSSATPGQLDSYVFGQADGGATIFAVQTNLYARKDDANVRQIAPLIRMASTDYIGTTVTEAATYTDFTQLYNLDPTAAAWTPTSFNAAEFGVKEIA